MIALTEGLEDYLEAILMCEREHRFVRTKHLAARLGVTSPSVNAAVRELANRRLVEHESYGHIELTSQGRREAERVYTRHRTLHRFFAHTLGLPNDLAERNACGIEHHLIGASMDRFTKLLAFLDSKAREDAKFARELKKCLEKDQHVIS